MRAAVPVSSVQVPPDPAITSAIGRHHSLETAIADLVDNSIDAGARIVQVRFLLEGGVAVGLQVLDDGCGMDTTAVDAAMRYAHRHKRAESALGHFGVGLKAASLSQAETLLVWSRRFGAPAVGRRLRRSTLDSGPVVESFSTRDAERRLASTDGLPDSQTGTLVEWEDVRTFLHDDDPTEQTKWLEKTVEAVLRHLGWSSIVSSNGARWTSRWKSQKAARRAPPGPFTPSTPSITRTPELRASPPTSL